MNTIFKNPLVIFLLVVLFALSVAGIVLSIKNTQTTRSSASNVQTNLVCPTPICPTPICPTPVCPDSTNSVENYGNVNRNFIEKYNTTISYTFIIEVQKSEIGINFKRYNINSVISKFLSPIPISNISTVNSTVVNNARYVRFTITINNLDNTSVMTVYNKVSTNSLERNAFFSNIRTNMSIVDTTNILVTASRPTTTPIPTTTRLITTPIPTTTRLTTTPIPTTTRLTTTTRPAATTIRPTTTILPNTVYSYTFDVKIYEWVPYVEFKGNVNRYNINSVIGSYLLVPISNISSVNVMVNDGNESYLRISVTIKNLNNSDVANIVDKFEKIKATQNTPSNYDKLFVDIRKNISMPAKILIDNNLIVNMYTTSLPSMI